MHEREPITEHDQLEYYSRVGGHLTRLALLNTLADDPNIYEKSDVSIRNFLKFCELLRLGKDEEFLQSRRAGVVATSQGVATIAKTLNDAGIGEAALDMQVVNAMELYRDRTSAPPSKIGQAVVEIARRDIVPFYTARFVDNIELANKSTVGPGSAFLGNIDSLALNGEFYIGQYFKEEYGTL